jgi:hypothetical protein
MTYVCLQTSFPNHGDRDYEEHGEKEEERPRQEGVGGQYMP